jgi:hypothetical protein
VAGVRNDVEAGDRDDMAALLAPTERAHLDPSQRGGRLGEDVALVPKQEKGRVFLGPLGRAVLLLGGQVRRPLPRFRPGRPQRLCLEPANVPGQASH